jgi:dihydropteroate synthase
MDSSHFRISFTSAQSIDEAKRSLIDMGVAPKTADNLAPAMCSLTLKVKDLPKDMEEGLAAAAHGGCRITSLKNCPTSDCLINGTIDEVSHLYKNLKEKNDSLSPLGDAIETAVKNYRKADARDFSLEIGGQRFDLSDETLIMGVVNITPDSFSDGGKFFSFEKAVTGAHEMAAAGAHIIDIGGESTRPGSDPVPLDEELERVIPVIEKIRETSDIPISIDTYKSAVAKKALSMGASMVNDISGLNYDPDMAHLVAESRVPLIVMHIKGTPKNMQKDPTYDDLLAEIIDTLSESVNSATGAGIAREKIIVDPGIGFGKTWDDNLKIIRQIRDFYVLGHPVLIGASRKAFIGGITGKDAPLRLWGSIGIAACATIGGAHLVRVHDVEETRDAVLAADAVRRGAIKKAEEK